ncbi:MAG: tRNA (cytidine(34)-2'-O)-methyltransferase [Pirellulales bacterium]
MKYEPVLHIVLHQPEIPYNTGNIGRTCVAVGAKLWLVRPLGFRVDDYHLRRAGLDYWEQLEWEAVDDWPTLAGRLAPRKPWVFSKSAETEYTDAMFQPGDVLLFGSETSGLPDALIREYADRALRIATRPEVRSLNLSNAVAIVAYEAVRQWKASSS